jgi:hypothetical protein
MEFVRQFARQFQKRRFPAYRRVRLTSHFDTWMPERIYRKSAFTNSRSSGERWWTARESAFATT